MEKKLILFGHEKNLQERLLIVPEYWSLYHLIISSLSFIMWKLMAMLITWYSCCNRLFIFHCKCIKRGLIMVLFFIPHVKELKSSKRLSKFNLISLIFQLVIITNCYKVECNCLVWHAIEAVGMSHSCSPFRSLLRHKSVRPMEKGECHIFLMLKHHLINHIMDLLCNYSSSFSLFTSMARKW